MEYFDFVQIIFLENANMIVMLLSGRGHSCPRFIEKCKTGTGVSPPRLNTVGWMIDSIVHLIQQSRGVYIHQSITQMASSNYQK